MRAIIFDSSFLMAVSRTPTTWADDLRASYGNYTPVLLECVKDELTSLVKSGGRRGKDAAVALQISSGFERGPCGHGAVDDELVSSALTFGAPVATVDRGLIASLRASKAQVVTLSRGRVRVA